MEQQQFYWELIQKDGTVIEIPPDAVNVVKRRWEQGLPIHTKYSGSIPPDRIAAFRPTDKLANTQPLLEEVARAFNEPILTDEGSIAAKWVKKQVTQNKWDKYYSPSGYRKLSDMNGMVTIAFRLPVHQINPQLVQYCTEDEVRQLETR